jgi:RimJ/RimL family protein N-acetyltransferase
MHAPDEVVTNRLRGRRPTKADLDYVAAVACDARVTSTQFDGTQPLPARFVLGRWLQIWEAHGIGFWLFSEESGNVVGHGGLFPSPRESGAVEAGCALRPSAWARGHGTEIVHAVLSVGFRDVGLDRIIAFALASNAASLRVMVRCGMTYDGERESSDGARGVRYAIRRDAIFPANGGRATMP